MHNHDGISALPDTLVDRVSWQLSSKVISQWIDKHNDNIQHANVQTCVLHVCQYNAQSLIKCGADKLLAAQACKRKVHIIGVQESRYKKCRIFSCGPFLRVTSGSPHGTHGCEIWFSLTLPFAKINQCDCYVDANSVTILHHEPRRLLVKCCCANKSFVCVSLHAPYLGNDELDVSKWWCETLGIIKKFCTNSPTFVLLMPISPFQESAIQYVIIVLATFIDPTNCRSDAMPLFHSFSLSLGYLLSVLSSPS